MKPVKNRSVYISPDHHYSFKLLAAGQGMTLQKCMEQVIESALESAGMQLAKAPGNGR